MEHFELNLGNKVLRYNKKKDIQREQLSSIKLNYIKKESHPGSRAAL